MFFNNKGTKLELFPIAELAKDMNLPEPSTKEKNSFNGITFAINVKSEADVDELIQKAKAVGGEIVKPPEKVFWGGYSGYFKDLDGYHGKLPTRIVGNLMTKTCWLLNKVKNKIIKENPFTPK